MSPTALIDTNILIYTYEVQDKVRQTRALSVLSALHATGCGYMSVKTLSEFFVVVRRIPHPLTNDQALNEMQKHILIWPILDLTPAIVLEAARGVKDYGFSYWDAQMWATAKIHHLTALFTEDMNTGSTIEGVEIINPLDEKFDLTDWLSQ